MVVHLCLLLARPSSASELSGDAALQALLSEHAHPLALREERLVGPGSELLLSAAADARFVAVGEQHYTAEIPLVVAALFRELHDRHGFQYLALESDPVSAWQASSAPLRGRLDALGEHASRYPFAWTFPTDQELAMVAAAGALSQAQTPIWGLDQSFGALHTLDFAVASHPPLEQRPEVRALREDCLRIERRRTRNPKACFDKLRAPETWSALAPLLSEAAPLAAWALEQLLLSERIYRPYLERSDPDAQRASALAREENMGAQLVRGMQAARAAGEASPRALLKLGHIHLTLDRQPMGFPSLGDFARALAHEEGGSWLSVAAFVHGPRGHWRSMHGWEGYGPLVAAVSEEDWTVVDLRPVRLAAEAGRLAGASEPLLQLAASFDAVLVLSGAGPGTFERLRARR